MKSEKRQSLKKSFGHAWDGLLYCIKRERNMKIHCTIACAVIIFGFVLKISAQEWGICFALFGLVMGMELINTAIEMAVDLVTQEWQPLAGRAKDVAAGAVLISSIMAAAAGLVIFVPKLWAVIF